MEGGQGNFTPVRQSNETVKELAELMPGVNNVQSPNEKNKSTLTIVDNEMPHESSDVSNIADRTAISLLYGHNNGEMNSTGVKMIGNNGFHDNTRKIQPMDT